MPIDTPLATLVELLKLAGPALSAVLLYLYRQQRVRSSANEAAIASVIEVNDELRKELGRKSQQLLDMENAQNRLEASLDEQRINHATEMNRYIKMREDSARELEFELRAARATIAHLRAEVADLRRQIAEWEKVIKLDPHDYVKTGQDTDTN